MEHVSRRDVLRGVGATGIAASGLTSAVSGQDVDLRVVRVPGDYPTVQEAVDAARAGDLVLVDAGVYDEEVSVETSGVTIRGTDRNRVVLDGEFERPNGVDVDADRVAVENLTVRNYEVNGVYWTQTEGFRASHLTAYNNGEYGLYAYECTHGRFEHSYASGHSEAGFYVGYGNPFHAVIADVIAENNAWGYSGTSAGGDLTIRDSVWRHNRAGIVPNTLSEDQTPQRDARIVRNEVYDNNNADAPARELTHPGFGSGILLWGGSENLVANNEVRDHQNFGIAVQSRHALASDNVVRENAVSESAIADLALGTPVGDGNRFVDNEYGTSLPSDLQSRPSSGSSRVADVFSGQLVRAENGDFPRGDWRRQPVPDDQPSMPDPQRPPLPVDKSHGYGGG